MISFIIGLALGLFIGLFLSSVRAMRDGGDISMMVGSPEDKIAVGISIDWPEILAIAAVGLIAYLLYKQM